jgi:hypothetical protein
VAALQRIVTVWAVVGYLVVALTPCSGRAEPPSAGPVPAHHAGPSGHASDVGAETPPPCHAPSPILSAPCLCGCGERAVSVSTAKLGAPLLSEAPLWIGPSRPAPAVRASERLRAPDLEGVDPVPRPV